MLLGRGEEEEGNGEKVWVAVFEYEGGVGGGSGGVPGRFELKGSAAVD